MRLCSPAFFMLSGTSAAIGVAADGTLLIPEGVLPAGTGRRAKPGETIILFATGFGLADPPHPTAHLVPGHIPLAERVTITVGGVEAQVFYSALVGSGLCQFNIVVPATVAGDQPVVATVDGVESPGTMFLAVEPN